MSLFKKFGDRWSEMLTGHRIGQTPSAKQSTAKPAHESVPANPPGQWPLDRVLLNFYSLDTGGRDVATPFTLYDGFVGTFVFGSTGSGKSSGSGRHLAAAWLRIGAGGLVLVAKDEEVKQWERYVEEAGRTKDLIVFGKGRDTRFNFLDYELSESQGNPAEAATDVIVELLEASGRKGGGENDFWVDASRQLIQNCLDLLMLAGEPAGIRQILQLAVKEEAVDAALVKAEKRAAAKELTESQILDLDVSKDYLCGEWRNMDEKPKSGVLMTASTLLSRFQKGVLRDLFTGKSTHSPDDILEGKILVVDCAVLTNHEAGRIANLIWKSALQRAVQRRPASDESRPVFIFGDECQHFLTKGDAKFVTTSRSYRCGMVYMTQNMANVVEAIGKDGADGFLGNFRTKIWHQQDDSSTNEWAANTISKAYKVQTTKSRNFNTGGGKGGPSGGGGTSQQDVLEYQLLPGKFLELATGGKAWGLVVTGYVFISGRMFPTGKTYAECGFNQKKVTL